MFIVLLAAVAQGQVDTRSFVAGTLDRERLPTERTVDYKFKEVRIDTVERWLSWARIRLPIDVSGNVSGWVWAQRSSRGLFNFSDYWLEGELLSPKLVVDKWTVDSANWRFGYRNGTWFVGRLQGAVTPPNQDNVAGEVQLVAKLPTSDSAVLEIGGNVTSVDLGELLKSFEVDVPITNRGGSLTVSASVPFDRYRDLKYLQADARLSLNEVAVPSVRDPVLLTAKANLRDGRWALNDALLSLQADPDRLPVRVTADGPLQAPWPFAIQVAIAQMDAADLLRQLDAEPFAPNVEGAFSVSAQANGDADRGIASAEIDLRADQLTIEQQPIRGVTVTGKLLDHSASARFQLTNLLDGSLVGSANWNDLRNTQQGKPNRIALSLDKINLSAIKIPTLANVLSGIASGRVEFQSQLNEDGTSGWGSSGEVAVLDSTVLASQLGDVDLTWSKPLDRQNANATLSLTKGDGRANATIEAVFDDRLPTLEFIDHLQSYRAEGSITNLSTIFSAPSIDDALPVTLSGNFEFSGSRKNGIERGQATLQSLATEVLGRSLHVTDAIVEASPEEFRLRQFTLDDSDGRVLGAGILRRVEDGEHLVRLALSDVALADYWNALAPTDYVGVDGRISTQIELTVPADRSLNTTDIESLGRYASGTVSGAVRGLSFRSAAIGDVDFRGELDEGTLNATADGEILQGTAEVTIEINDAIQQVTTAKTETPLETRIDAKLNAAQIESLLALTGIARSKAVTQGTASVALNASFVAGQLQSARGQVSIPRFIYDREPLAQELFIDVELIDSQLAIRQASGKIASGLFNASGSVAIPSGNGELLFSIQQVDAGQIASLLYPQGADQFAGRLSYRGRARIGREVSFVGAATTSNATLYGFPLQSVRGAVQMEFDRVGNFNNFVATNLVGTALGGQLNAEMQVRGGSSFSLRADGRLRRGKMEQLSRALGFDRIVGSENFNSAFQFNSRDAFDLGALNGRLQVDFDNGDAQSIPILSDLNRLVPLMQLASTEITSGRLDARVGQGLLQIENLLLNSEAFWIAGNGNASLRTGNLDLQGVLQTGGGLEAQVSQASLRRLATVLLPEVVFIAELDNLLRNRTLYFRVRGSTNRPVIQPRIAPSIARGLLQEVKRSLLVAPRVIAASDD